MRFIGSGRGDLERDREEICTLKVFGAGGVGQV